MHFLHSNRRFQSSSCPDGLRQSCIMYATHTTMPHTTMPHTPHAVHISFRPVRDQFVYRWTETIRWTEYETIMLIQSCMPHTVSWTEAINHVCHTHHTQCTFASDQFVSRWTEAIMYAFTPHVLMYATHTTRSARFLQSSSCPDVLRQSCMPMPHTPHAVHTQCTFPSEQFVSEAIMYATHTTRPHTRPHTPHAVHVSFRPVRVQMHVCHTHTTHHRGANCNYIHVRIEFNEESVCMCACM